MTKQGRGIVKVDQEACNGCGLCVESCPLKALELSPEPNRRGVRSVRHVGEACVGCGTCHYFCPELKAIQVCRPDEHDAREQYPPAA